MHVVHLVKTTQGAAWVANLIRQVKQRRSDITFSVVAPPGGRFHAFYLENCRSFHPFDFKLNAGTLANGRRLREIIKSEEPDIVHSWFVQTTIYARLFLRGLGVARLFEVVGPLHLENPLLRMVDIGSANKLDYWKATSHYIYNKYKGSVKDKQLFHNYIGIDLSDLQHQFELSEEVDLRKQYNIPDEVKIVGTASYFYPPKLFQKRGVKNHEMLILSFGELLKKRKDVVLFIAGSSFGNDTTYEERIKELANKVAPDKIIFTGYAPNVGRVIVNFDVFVYLSLAENLGGVYESLYFRIPTISSNKGALPELVEDGRTGYLVDPDNPAEVAEKMELLLESEEVEQFVKHGRSKVEQIFDIEQSIKGSLRIYEEIVKKQK